MVYRSTRAGNASLNSSPPSVECVTRPLRSVGYPRLCLPQLAARPGLTQGWHSVYPKCCTYASVKWVSIGSVACRLFGAKLSSKPMLGYCQLDPLGTNFSEISIKINKSFTKCIWKYRLRNSHFVQGEMSSNYVTNRMATCGGGRNHVGMVVSI